MPIKDRPVVLIAYPPEFGHRKMFAEKVTRALSSLSNYSIVSPDDPRGFVAELFEERLLPNNKPMKRREIKQLFDEITHAVIFWDGITLTPYVYYASLFKTPHRIIPIETTRVVNRDKSDPYDVYIGRGSPWGNPYPIGKDGDSRETVINKFRDYFRNEILSDESKRTGLLSLRGKTLGCHCKPLPCHGDIIAEYLNTLELD